MTEEIQKITVRRDGPYIVLGRIPLVRKKQVMSVHGEPLDWQKESDLSTEEVYRLCRCGHSSTKPFCDGTHTKIDFDGCESADIGPVSDRQANLEGKKIVVKDDRSLCMHAGFCGNRFTNIWKMIKEPKDSEVRAEVIAMVEKCPSGALSFASDDGGSPTEPDLPKEVVVIPDGPLWLTGGIPGGAVRLAAPRDPQPGHLVPLRRLEEKAALRWLPQECGLL